MDSSRFQRMMEIFDAAGRLTGAARRKFIADQCGQDADLQREIEALFAHDRESLLTPGGGMQLLADTLPRTDEPPAMTDRVVDGLPATLPQLSGQYRIIGVLGEGGMGVVYEAEQLRPRRRVALKAIRSGFASEHVLKRFEHEAHILARLHHPGIAQIFEAGSSDAENGQQAFFAMEFIAGKPLNTFSAERRLSIPARMELVARVCDAVQHAHQRGVIHRDLKPSNILVVDDPDNDVASASGGTAKVLSDSVQPKILDFGVARAVGKDTAATTMHTMSGQIIGTLPYMSPEQIAAEPDEIDTRCDIYAIGVLLYELLSGQLPHDLNRRTLPDAARIIRDEQPQPLGTLNRACRGEIETIVARAMNKERDRRYVSAAALAVDLRRFIAGEPIDARRDSTFYMLRANLRRHRIAVTTATLFILLLVAFGVISFRQAMTNLELANQESAARKLADAARITADATAARLADELRSNNIERGRLAAISGNRLIGEELLWREFLKTPDALDARWALWESYMHNPCRRSISPHNALVNAVKCSADGALIATHGDDGYVRVWESQNFAIIDEFPAPASTKLGQSISFNHDGTLLAAIGPDRDFVIRDPRRRVTVRSISGLPRNVDMLRFSPDGRMILALWSTREVWIWDAATGELKQKLDGFAANVVCAAIHPDGVRVAVGMIGGSVEMREIATGRSLITSRLHDDWVSTLEFSPDGTSLASGSRDRMIKTWNVADLKQTHLLEAPNGTVRGMRYIDENTLFTVGWWSIDIWDIATQQRKWSVAFPSTAGDISPGGRILYSTESARLHAWDTATARERQIITGFSGRVCSTYSGDGRVVATGDSDGRIRLFNGRTGQLMQEFAADTERVRSLQFAPDGQTLMAASDNGIVRRWDIATATATPFGPRANCQSVCSIAYSPDGTLVAITNIDRCLTFLDTSTAQIVARTDPMDYEQIGVRFTADGNTVALTTRESLLTFYRTDGSRISQAECPSVPWTLDYSCDGSRLIVGNWRNDVQVHDASDGRLIAVMKGHRAVVYGIACHPRDPRIVASASADGTVRLWDIETKRCLITLDGFDGWDVITVEFNPEGTELTAAGANGTIVKWDLTYYDSFIEGNREFQRGRLARDEFDAETFMARKNGQAATQPVRP